MAQFTSLFHNANKSVGNGVDATDPATTGYNEALDAMDDPSYPDGNIDTGRVIYSPGLNKTSYIIELDVASLGNSGVQVDVRVYDSSESTTRFVVRGAPVPVGSALSVIDNQKIVLEEGDELIVECMTPGEYVDVFCSLVEDVNNK